MYHRASYEPSVVKAHEKQHVLSGIPESTISSASYDLPNQIRIKTSTSVPDTGVSLQSSPSTASEIDYQLATPRTRCTRNTCTPSRIKIPVKQFNRVSTLTSPGSMDLKSGIDKRHKGERFGATTNESKFKKESGTLATDGGQTVVRRRQLSRSSRLSYSAARYRTPPRPPAPRPAPFAPPPPPLALRPPWQPWGGATPSPNRCPITRLILHHVYISYKPTIRLYEFATIVTTSLHFKFYVHTWDRHCANVQVCKCANVQTCKRANVQCCLSDAIPFVIGFLSPVLIDFVLEFQRQIMEQKMRQKRQNVGMVQANDLRISSAKHRPSSGARGRELHGMYASLDYTWFVSSIRWNQVKCMLRWGGMKSRF